MRGSRIGLNSLARQHATKNFISSVARHKTMKPTRFIARPQRARGEPHGSGSIMKITDIRITGLAGGTVEGGWADELCPEDDVHTIVEILTDEGLTGVGSVYTSKALVQGAVKLMHKFLIG